MIAIALTGDPVAGTWSIGGPYSGALGLLSEPEGISFSHNQYESDASPARVSFQFMPKSTQLIVHDSTMLT